MNKCPQIGGRVRYKGGLVVGPCVGVVTAIYPTFVYDDVRDRPTNTPKPEREWHVGIKVDTKPAKWSYPGDVFAPEVSGLTRVK